MRLYLRLIHNDLSGPEFERQVRLCMASAPGVQSLKEIKADPRGGYHVIGERTEGDIEPLIQHLCSFGFRGVI
jgi:hypothetical protein